MKEYNGFRVDRLKEVMEKHEVTRDDIAAELLAITKSAYPIGIRSHVNKIINGYWQPDCEELIAICEACNCTSDYLLWLSDEI